MYILCVHIMDGSYSIIFDIDDVNVLEMYNVHYIQIA